MNEVAKYTTVHYPRPLVQTVLPSLDSRVQMTKSHLRRDKSCSCILYVQKGKPCRMPLILAESRIGIMEAGNIMDAERGDERVKMS